MYPAMRILSTLASALCFKKVQCNIFMTTEENIFIRITSKKLRMIHLQVIGLEVDGHYQITLVELESDKQQQRNCLHLLKKPY